AHVVPYALDGSVLLEIFTHDGVGTMVVEDTLDDLRPATLDDVGAILSLIEPLEADGTLVPRPRSVIEREVERFTVLEHDGVIYGCAALHPYPDEHMAEMACLIVHPEWQGSGEGELLLRHMESRARAIGARRLFVLTTRTSHWFMKRGFVPGGIADLPREQQNNYNRSRTSLVFIKTPCAAPGFVTAAGRQAGPRAAKMASPSLKPAANHVPYRQLCKTQARGRRAGLPALSRRTRHAHLAKRLQGSLGRLETGADPAG